MVTEKNCWFKKENTQECDEFLDGICSENCKYMKWFRYMCMESELPEHDWFPIKLIAPNDDIDAYLYLNEFKNNIGIHVAHGDNVYIYSKNNGNGKSSWAKKILLNYFNHKLDHYEDRPVGVFVDVADFMFRSKFSFKQEDAEFVQYCDKIRQANLVVWDDIGMGALTAFENTVLLGVLNYRLSNGKSNVYTSNLEPEQLYETFGNKLADRIINLSDLVEFRCDSLRGYVV